VYLLHARGSSEIPIAASGEKRKTTHDILIADDLPAGCRSDQGISCVDRIATTHEGTISRSTAGKNQSGAWNNLGEIARNIGG
jgi:hypothetical protein